MKYKYYKGPPLNRGGDLPFYVEIKNDLVDLLYKESCKLHAWMYGKEEWKLDPSTHSPKNNWEILKDRFPIIYDFKEKYNMTPNMIFLGFDKLDEINAYEDKPHTHNSLNGCALFFTIKHSDGAGTAFFSPEEKDIETLEYEYDNGWTLKLEECSHSVPPTEVCQFKTPHLICTNHFHGAYKIKDHPDNTKRVTMNWETNMAWHDFERALNDS
tara:strand:+ start:1880 stop:2518 length:639 start_codon:yes stop_codon:yes gene_type:complete